MMKYVILLRGINVGGNNSISMKILKEHLITYGFEDVQTYINSGNIIVTSLMDQKEEVKILFEEIIRKEFKLDIVVLVLYASELLEMSLHCPKWWNVDEDARHNALFVIPPITSKEIMDQIGELNREIERAEFADGILFWTVKNEFYTKSKYAKILGKSFYSSLTVRNANTFNKLKELIKS